MLPLLLAGFAMTFVRACRRLVPALHRRRHDPRARRDVLGQHLGLDRGRAAHLRADDARHHRGVFRARPRVPLGDRGQCAWFRRLRRHREHQGHAGHRPHPLPADPRHRERHLHRGRVEPRACAPQRLARGPAPCRDRHAGRAHGHPQPAALRRAPAARLGAEHPRSQADRAPARGHRSLQGLQRPLRTPGRGRGDEGGRGRARALRAPAARPGRALRRRGVRRHPLRHQAGERRAHRRGDPGGGAAARASRTRTPARRRC